MKLSYCFSWNRKIWGNPFKRALSYLDLSSQEAIDILDVGCSRGDAPSLMVLPEIKGNLVISYYEADKEIEMLQFSENINKNYCSSDVNLSIKQLDIFDCKERYNYIFMKSVLGGIFRLHKSEINELQEFLLNVAKNNLRHGGAIILLDNGQSIFEPILRKFGARKNAWRFFNKSDINFADEQFSFGFFSAFAFSSRLGKFGNFVEDFIIYPLDYMMWILGIRAYPTVIVSIILAR